MRNLDATDTLNASWSLIHHPNKYISCPGGGSVTTNYQSYINTEFGAYARFRGYKSTFGVLSTFSASWDRIQETSTFPSHNSPEVFRGSYSGELSVFLSHVHDRTLRCDATGAISGHASKMSQIPVYLLWHPWSDQGSHAKWICER